MLGYPISTQPISTLPPGLVVVTTQQSTVRFASEGFVTRATDVPASTYIQGRIAAGLRLSRELTGAAEGQFGALIEARFGEIVLNNADGALDSLIGEWFSDGRQIRLKIGAKEVVAADRIMPRYIATGAGASSGDASVPYEIEYPKIVLFQELWTGSDGAAWSTQRWNAADIQGTGAVDIQGNAGRLLAQGVSQGRARIISKSGQIANFDLTTQVTIASGDQTANNEFHNLNFRASGVWSATNEQDRLNGYSLEFRTASGVQSFQLVSVVNSARRTLGSVSKSFGTSPWFVRLRCEDSAIQAKAWQGSEPGTWDIEVADQDHVSGDFSLSTVNGTDGAARTATWDDLVADELTARGVIPGDFLVAQLTINDRGAAPALTSIPTGWLALSQETSGPLHQALLYRFADGDEAGQTQAFEWESGDAANDVIVGRIHQFRYVDPDQPWEPGEIQLVLGDLDSIALPALDTFERNSLATYWVSWSDNASTQGPSGQIGGDWNNLGDIVSSSVADDVANRRAGAQMVEPGTISGGSIQTTPTDSPVSEVSLLVGTVLRGLPSAGGQERVQAYENFETVYTAVAGHWSFGEQTTVRLRIQTLAAKLQNRLQQLTYAGSGSSNGTADLTGRTRPLCFGHCLNVSAQLVDPTLLIFQVHSGAIEAIEAVYDRAVSVPFVGSPGGQDFATYAALAAASVAPGFFSTCLAEGYFRIGAGADPGSVTADVKGDEEGGYVDTHAMIIRRMLLAYSPLVSADLDAESFTDFDEDQPAEIGIFFPAGDQTTIEEAIARVAFAGGALAGQDRSGLYRVQQLTVPATAQHWTFTDRDIIEIERMPLPYGVPWKAWEVAYERNWTVQAGSDVAAGVSQARRQFLEAEARYVSETSSAISLSHATSAGAPSRPTLFHVKADAEAEALRLLEFYALGRALYRVTVKTALFSVEIGQTVRLVYPRWNLSGGRNHVAISIFDDADRRITEMLLFG